MAQLVTEATPEPVVTEVIGGIDTHADTHTVAALDQIGRLLGTATFPATLPGFRDLTEWLRAHGRCVRVGVEGTGSYGMALTQHLQAGGIIVSEVNRPDRSARRARGKDDPTDALSAARAVLAEDRIATPKDHTGPAEAIRNVLCSYNLMVKQRAHLQTQFKSLLVTAPETIRATLKRHNTAKMIATAARYRPNTDDLTRPEQAVKLALQAIAHQHQSLTATITDLHKTLDRLTRQQRPDLRAQLGYGPINTAQLICTYGENPDRIHTEGAFAKLCGTAPIAASSGKISRHRLNRGGDRQANCAIHTIMLTRLRHDPRTRAYRDRRTAEGKSKRDAYRCLKRFITREIYNSLSQPPNTP